MFLIFRSKGLPGAVWEGPTAIFAGFSWMTQNLGVLWISPNPEERGERLTRNMSGWVHVPRARPMSLSERLPPYVRVCQPCKNSLGPSLYASKAPRDGKSVGSQNGTKIKKNEKKTRLQDACGADLHFSSIFTSKITFRNNTNSLFGPRNPV